MSGLKKEVIKVAIAAIVLTVLLSAYSRADQAGVKVTDSALTQDSTGDAMKGQIKGEIGAYNASIKTLGDQVIALQAQADEIIKQTQFFNAVRGEIEGD